MESVQRLRDEEEEEEEEEGDSGLVARARASTDIQKTSEQVGVDTTPSRLDEVEEETPGQVPEPRGTEDTLPRGEETIEDAVDADAETGLEARREEGDAPKNLLGASVLHREVFLRSRGELSRCEALIQGLTVERDAFKLFSEQRVGEAEGLRAELEATRKEQADLSEQFRVEVDAVKAEAEEWKKNMDHLALEKEAAGVQLASAETQLRVLKEKALVQAKKIEEFQSRLGSTTSDRERLATELAEAKSEVKIATANANAMVVVHRSDAKAAQVQAKDVSEAAQARANRVAEHTKCQSRRETLEEIYARGFDLTAEIENAKELEAEARVLAFSDDDDTGSMSGSE
ncbi:uncharacterized protein [Nicotiana tomentosiformis]|uniref:uncharacterized protein n=1 Tax=Nicotiana tomentosiformis TaxID=4098 RepID=UPI00388C7DFE